MIETMIGRGPAVPDLMVFFSGFMLACLAYCFLIAGLIAGAQKLLTPTLHRIVSGACGVVLIGFAIVLGREGLRLLPWPG